MPGSFIIHKSDEKVIANLDSGTLEEVSKNGLKWKWSVSTGMSWNATASKLEEYVYMMWQFDWDELKNRKEIESFKGTITVKLGNPSYESSVSPQTIFAPSEFSDVALVVEGKKIHVNKGLLSVHSNYFRALFSSDFKEKSATEIPIEDVDYEDFATLLSLVYPSPVFPNANVVGSILVLADRFILPSVSKIVDADYVSNYDLEFGLKISMADKYNMEKLLKQCVGEITCHDDVKNLSKNALFMDLSNETKAKILIRSLSF
ncbi:unnamed protein product [Caenorhabditis sp. 36 PRJEB53466]|nr:unnamed protein product [Caenorhabditis sp. 36 PRJEB53466]